MSESPDFRTRQGHSTPAEIFVRDLNLTDELIGELDLGEMTYLVLRGQKPDDREARMVNAVLVTLVEHGLTPSALATRLTAYGEPESLQGAVASGLLGVGSRFVGPTQDVAELLQTTLREHDEESLETMADGVVSGYRERGEILPGLGHPEHDPDPRTVELFELAETLELSGDGVALIRAVQQEAEERLDRSLPINVTGAIGAILTDMGFDWQVARGFSVISRCVGLVGHFQEELEDPIGPKLWTLMGNEED